MRIIAGDLKGRQVSLPKHSRTRPITSFVLEQAMNLYASYGCELGQRLPSGPFLDVCAGSGLIGFEALSRGASRVIFIEADADTAANLRSTAERFEVRERVQVMRMDARKCVSAVAKVLLPEERISAAFLDPPFIPRMAADVLSHFARGLELAGPQSLLSADCLLLIRADDPVPTELPALNFLEKRPAGNAWIYMFKPRQ
ncbi:RsmD family RNA methyltransferase [bacterium]|nr:RsmD family RNA methyltransferase [bacterium]